MDIRKFYEENIYGTWQSGEKVTYKICKKSEREPSDSPFKLSTTDDGIDVEIIVEKENRKASFTVRAYLPENREHNSYIICMHPILPKEYALQKGYALLFMDTSMVAEDNNLRKGAFYDLYPYTQNPEEQTGELMAWGWAASKILDAIYGGLDQDLGIDKEKSAITGVSRWGKATAVCGAFEKRFKVVIPVCSGAGGLALWKYQSEGKSYDLSEIGGPSDYVYGQNEPLSCLQSEAEQGWFNDRFLQYHSYDEIEVEQYMLPVLASDSNRWYYIVAAWMGEDWVNAPAMMECYLKAKKEYDELGLGDHIFPVFHKEGHALLREDLEIIFSQGRFFSHAEKIFS